MEDSLSKNLTSLELESKPNLDFEPEFPLFPTFPTEIRLKVWEFALDVPRTVTITCTQPTLKTLKLGTLHPGHTFRSDHRPPPLLHVNQESREEALAVYKPYFKTSRVKGTTYVSGQSYIYVSFALDTLRFIDSVLSYLAEPELQGIQTLILDVRDSAYFGHFNMEILKQMKNLKVLDMWADRGVTYSWQDNSYLHQLLRCFDEMKEFDLGWECPA